MNIKTQIKLAKETSEKIANDFEFFLGNCNQEVFTYVFNDDEASICPLIGERIANITDKYYMHPMIAEDQFEITYTRGIYLYRNKPSRSQRFWHWLDKALA